MSRWTLMLMVAGVLLLDCTVRSIPAIRSDKVAEALSTSVVNLSLTSCQVSSLDLRRMFNLSSRDMITCRSSSIWRRVAPLKAPR